MPPGFQLVVVLTLALIQFTNCSRDLKSSDAKLMCAESCGPTLALVAARRLARWQPWVAVVEATYMLHVDALLRLLMPRAAVKP